MQEIPIYIADTPCLVRVGRDGVITEVLALDGGGPDRGPRKVSVSRELLASISLYIKEVIDGIQSAEAHRGVREELSGIRVDNSKEEGTVSSEQ